MVRFIHVFVSIIIMTFLLHINAEQYWLPNLPTFIPEPNTEMSCHDWLISYGFQELDIVVNRDLARRRDRLIDGPIFIWAVIYAHELTAYNPSEEHDLLLKPQTFCDTRGMDNNKFRFSAFDSLQTTCEGWILLYRYYLEFPTVNHNIAIQRNINADGIISLWVASYARYIHEGVSENAIRIDKFCKGMVPYDKVTNFMSFNDTRMTCKEWIQLSGYNDNIAINIKMAKKQKKNFYNFINSWTKMYVDYLLDSGGKKRFLWCGSYSSVENDFLDPLEFCESRGYTDSTLKSYFIEDNDE